MMPGRWAYALSVFCLLQLRAEATLPGEDVGGAPEVRYQGRERVRDRASGEVSCADVIISAFPLLLVEARVYLVDISSSFFCSVLLSTCHSVKHSSCGVNMLLSFCVAFIRICMDAIIASS